MSNEIDAPVLKVIQDAIADKKINMDLDEAKRIYLTIFQDYRKEHGDHPSITDPAPTVRRMAEAIRILKNYKIRNILFLLEIIQLFILSERFFPIKRKPWIM